MEHQAKHETGLDGCRRIDWLAAALASSRRTPCCYGLFCEPERQASPPNKSSVVLRPMRHPISRLGELVATAFVKLVRHGLPAMMTVQPGDLTGRPSSRPSVQEYPPR